VSATFEEGEAEGGEVQLTLDAMLIYEDLSTGLRAKDVAVFTRFGETPLCEGGVAVDEIHDPAPAKTALWAEIRRWPEQRSDWGINE